MKRIRILHYGLSSHLGGIETYLKKITSFIDKNIFEFCFLITEQKKPCFFDELIKMGCTFYYITSRRENFFKNYVELKQLLKKERFDIIHCHLNSLSYISPMLIVYNYGCKVIVHSHNAGLKATIAVRISHKINYYRLQKKDIEYIAVSDYAGKWMFGRKNFTILNNGVDVNRFCYSDIARQQARKKYNISDKEVIIHVGAFRHQKNHIFIIEIFNEYSKRHSDAVLMLVGDGEQKKQIEKLINSYRLSDKVMFMGLTDNVSQLLNAADKFLFPSLYEGFPNALIEAECAGLFCVVSDKITKQVCIDSMCTSVSLDAPVETWVTELEKKHEVDRKNGVNFIMEKGLDTDSEIRRISAIYRNLTGFCER